MRTLSSKIVYESPWLTLREDETELADGSRGLYTFIDKPDFALVIPLENDGFHLIEEYRYPLGERRWQFPQGGFPKGVTGTPEQLAAAELVEETGFTAGRLVRLGHLNAAHGITNQGFHVFLATDLTAGEPRREVTEQDMRQEWFPRTEVERMIRDGVITDDSSLAAYLLLRMHAEE